MKTVKRRMAVQRKRISHRIGIIGLLLLVGLLGATIGSAKSVLETKDTLIVGMELSYPPFEMTDEKGTPKGVSVDLADALGNSLGKKIIIQNTAFDGLIPALQSGKIDLIISSMTITDERKKAIDFSDPYLSTGLCLLVGKTSSVHSIEDLDRAGISVAVKKGTTGHLFASQKIKNAKILVLDKEASAILEVVQGKADAFIYDQMSTYQNWKKNPGTTRALLRPFQEEHWGIALRKGEESLKEQINRFLKTFRRDGGFERLGEIYLKEQKETFKELGYPFYF
jgi:polar amino acid transport system substrate-binding protein